MTQEIGPDRFPLARWAGVLGLALGLAGSPAPSLAADAVPVRVGDRVEVYYGGEWFPATIDEVLGGYVRATFTDPRQYPATTTQNFQPIFLRAPDGREVSLVPVGLDTAAPEPGAGDALAPPRVGDPVEVYYGGVWFPATVTAVAETGSVRAAFTDQRQYPPEVEELFAETFVRRPAAARADLPPRPGAADRRPEAAATEPLPAAAPVPSGDARPAEAGGFVGDWALHSPAQAWISTWVADDWSTRIRTTTHTLHQGTGADGMGAVRIAADGTYRMAFLSEKWQGRWRPDPDGRGGIVLDDPEDPDDGWILFLADDGRPRALCATCTGESYQKLERIDAELAERLVAPADARQLVGRWQLWFQRWESGFVEVRADGTYRLDADGQTAEGRWEVDGESIRFPSAFGGDGWLHRRAEDPDRAVLVGAVTDLEAIRR